ESDSSGEKSRDGVTILFMGSIHGVGVGASGSDHAPRFAISQGEAPRSALPERNGGGATRARWATARNAGSVLLICSDPITVIARVAGAIQYSLSVVTGSPGQAGRRQYVVHRKHSPVTVRCRDKGLDEIA